jgi:hypothetical protein
MAEITKQALKVDNNTSFPNNNNGAITPSILRAFNTNMIDSLVDELGYNVDSASWNQQIDSLESITGSTAVSITNLNASSASQQVSINNLNVFTASAASLTTGSFLITASAASNVITFTKGNNTTFSVTVADTTDLSSLNQFTASAAISITNLNASSASQQVSINSLNSATASYVTETESGSFLITASFDNGNRNLTFTKGDNTTFAVNIPDVSGSTDTFVTTSSFNAYTQSNDQRVSSLETNSASVNTSISNLNTATSSLFTSASLGLTTASISGQTLTFSKGDGTTFGILIPDVSGSTIDTGSFATTGSNTFTGTQTINADLYVSGNTDLGFVNIRDLGGINLAASGSGPVTSYGIVTNPSNGDLVFNTNPGNGRLMTFNQTDGIMNPFNGMKLDTSFIGIDVYDHPLNLSSSFGGMTTMLNAQGNIIVTGSAIINGSLTASLQEGYVWVGDGTNKTTLVATSSFGGGGGAISVQDEGSILGNATSFNFNGAGVTATLSAGTASITIPGGSGAAGATLGTNTFTGSQIIQDAALSINNTGSAFFQMTAGTQNNILFNSPGNVFTSNGTFNLNNNGNAGGSGSLQFSAVSSSISYYSRDGFTFGRITPEAGPLGNGFVKMNTISGSFVLAPSGFSNNADNLLHLSGSSNSNNINLVFKNSNTTPDTIISGSNNIFTNPAAATAGFKRYLSGFNICLAGGLPQLSGSMQFSPAISNNNIGGQLTMRGPVSSSQWVISSNNILSTLNIGASAANHAQGIVAGLSMSSNSINGALSIVANRTNTTLNTNITANQILGTSTNLNMNSSSILLQNNLAGGTIVVNNNTTGSSRVSIQGNALSVAQNIMMGGVTITASGSNDPNDTLDNDYNANVYRNLVLGHSNTIQLQSGLTGSNSLAATSILGNNLIVTGSSPGPQFNGSLPGIYGSAFVGRFNAVDGNRALSAQTIFAVGTGTSTSVRKTGFLIDSGSNTFIEGTLNVSGSTSLTGSLTIQSGSAFFANGNRQFNVGAFSSLVTQSGSANVSQSMNFETTDKSEGVSIASNSQITLANSGTYNIQFSAQLLADGGADDVYIWLKKNGTNVSASAGHVVLANNEELIAAWNYVVDAAASDYFEIVWQSTGGDAVLLTETATGNIPSVPSVILTVTQVR